MQATTANDMLPQRCFLIASILALDKQHSRQAGSHLSEGCRAWAEGGSGQLRFFAAAAAAGLILGCELILLELKAEVAAGCEEWLLHVRASRRGGRVCVAWWRGGAGAR